MPKNHELNDKRARRIALDSPSGFLAFGLGAGLSPVAPGTAGTLAGMIVGFPLGGMPVWAGLTVVAVAFAAGIWICEHASRALGVHDHGGIVFDEIVGIWLVLVTVPFNWTWWLAAFVAFRSFDVAKPWPIRWMDRKIHGGFGIMLDDLVAAVYAAVLLGGVRWII